MSQIYKRVALIGLGLIASSISHAARRGDLAGEIVGTARSEKTRETAKRIGICDHVTPTATEAVKDADLVILCVPVGAMNAVAREIAPHLAPRCDGNRRRLGQTRDCRCCGPAYARACTLYSKPSGCRHRAFRPESGFAELFDNRWFLLTPLPGTDVAAKEKLTAFWRGLGANVDEMEVDHHDLVLAVTSHAPHLIAYTMVGVADDLSRVTDSEVINYSAAGFVTLRGLPPLTPRCGAMCF